LLLKKSTISRSQYFSLNLTLGWDDFLSFMSPQYAGRHCIEFSGM